TMLKVSVLSVLLLLTLTIATANGNFFSEAVGGTRDMVRAYQDMKEANYIGADKYFHARGNYQAAQRGPGGRFAAAVISNAREILRPGKDSAADQEANRHGRNGGDPNVYRPKGLPGKY
uniref:Serum amyloid A protein n=1 Tax=Petromyzon marinus TaxID=7757 RepID=S4RZ41_PETMA